MKVRMKIPATVSLIAIWLLFYLFVTTQNFTPIFCGKGIAKFGGEYYRFFTAGLLHSDLLHLLVNSSALFWIGYMYERQISTMRFAIIGVICAVAAQAVFLCIFSNTEESIGGSCYNYALCGFALVSSLFLPDFPKLKFGTWSGNWIGLYLLGSNVPILPSMDWTAIVIHSIAFALGGGMALLCCLFDVHKI